MSDLDYWTKELQAPAEARRREEADRAERRGKRLQRAKAEVKWLEAGSVKRPKRSS